MNQFAQFLTDTVTLRRADGTEHAGIKASVQNRKIFIFDVQLAIEPGDSVIRKLPSGQVEEFIVEDASFAQAFHRIPARWTLVCRRSNQRPQAPRSVTYNVSGSNSRVNVGSHDYSSNLEAEGQVGNVVQSSRDVSQTANVNAQIRDLVKLVTEFSDHLDELNLDARQKQRAEVQIATLKAQLTDEPDQVIVNRAGRSLRNITEGAIGSLLATAVQPSVWHWVHQVMAAQFSA